MPISQHIINRMIELYTEGYSLREVGAEVGYNRETVRKHLINNNIELRLPSSNPTGPNSPLWKGNAVRLNTRIRQRKELIDWRQKVLERDNNKCVWCKTKHNLEVDHIIPLHVLIKEYSITIESLNATLSAYPKIVDISNGRTLCQRCHRRTSTHSRATV